VFSSCSLVSQHVPQFFGSNASFYPISFAATSICFALNSRLVIYMSNSKRETNIYFRTIQSFDFCLFYVPIKNAHHIEKDRTLGVPTPYKHVWHMCISWFCFVFQISPTETRPLNKNQPNLYISRNDKQNPTFNMHHTRWVVSHEAFF
jgi:hypothetical protein